MTSIQGENNSNLDIFLRKEISCLRVKRDLLGAELPFFRILDATGSNVEKYDCQIEIVSVYALIGQHFFAPNFPDFFNRKHLKQSFQFFHMLQCKVSSINTSLGTSASLAWLQNAPGCRKRLMKTFMFVFSFTTKNRPTSSLQKSIFQVSDFYLTCTLQ